MNRRLWLRILVALLLVAVAALELAAMASAQHGFEAFLWPLVTLGIGTVLVIVLTALIQLIRHRFRFSLGSLLLAFLLVAVVLPILLGLVRRVEHYRLVSQVTVWGTRWMPEATAPEWVLKGLGDPWQYAFYDLSSLSASRPQDDAWVSLLENSLGVRDLELDGCQITEEAIARLGHLETLRSLTIRRIPLSDAAWRHLTQLPHLESLDLEDIAIGEEGLRHLAKCRHLTYLRIAPPGGIPSRLTETGLAELRQALPQCEIVVVPPPPTARPSPDDEVLPTPPGTAPDSLRE